MGNVQNAGMLNELTALARGISSRSVPRNGLLDILSEKNIPFEVNNMDFVRRLEYYLYRRTFYAARDQGIIANQLVFPDECAPISLPIADKIWSRMHFETAICEYISGTGKPHYEQWLEKQGINDALFDGPKEVSSRPYEQWKQWYQLTLEAKKYCLTQRRRYAMTDMAMGREFAYVLELALQAAGSEKTFHEATTEYVRGLGYDVELDLYPSIVRWRSLPEKPFTDPKLDLTIAIAPEVFRASLEFPHHYNVLPESTKNVPGFMLEDKNDIDISIELIESLQEARRTGRRRSDDYSIDEQMDLLNHSRYRQTIIRPYFDTENLDVCRALEIVRVIAQYMG